MRRRTPTAAVLALALLTASVGIGHESGGSGEPVPQSLVRAPDPATYRLGYASGDRPTLAAAVPGGPATPVLAGAAAASDADARAGVLVWVVPREAGGSDLFVSRPGAAAPIRLTNDAALDRHPALSPDGRQVAFTSDRGGNHDIWVLPVTGGTPRQLTNHPGDDTWPTWSPDGQQIAFDSTRDDPAGDIYRMAATGGAAVRLTADPAADTQPAWSPDGQRIALTTTRFGTASTPPTSAVVTIAAVGGTATRATPTTVGDAAEPAWAPDSRRLAFVSGQADRSGDVLVLDGTRVIPVATDPARAERQPVWRDTQVVHTTIVADRSQDVWSTDPAGDDRRDLTARPDLDEDAPAYSPDGLRLAYSAAQPDGGRRIVVADADGRNPRTVAPVGTAAGDLDTDPAWSPDGTMLAFARSPAADDDGEGDDGEPGPSRVLLARVADGVQVGELPIPRNLRGQDAEPAWSPDGTRLAVSRVADPFFSRVLPTWVDQPLLPGRQTEVAKTVLTPRIPDSPDIVFLMDTSGSMERIIETMKTAIVQIANDVKEIQPNAQFAFIGYNAFAFGQEDDYYHRFSDLTPDPAVLAARLAPAAATGGGEEGWYNAIFQAINGGPDERINLRPGGSPIFVLIGDAPSTGNARYPGEGEVTQQDAIDAMLSTNGPAKLVAVPVAGSGEDGLDFDDLDPHGLDPTEPNRIGEATEIADATDGVVTDDATADTIGEAVIDGITRTRVTVRPQVESCDDGVSLAFEPAQRERVLAGDPAAFTERITLAPGATPGAVLHCTVLFDVGSPVPPEEVRQEVTVRVSDPGSPDAPRPFVRVDDVTVTATGADGARVDYQATATAPDGTPLPAPTCTPPSGSVFRIGQTVVTCTARMGEGSVGQDIALVTVRHPAENREDGERIWVARIASATPDQITFGDQHQISARVTAPCHAGSSDRAPAWSPDGRQLAFSDRGQVRGICVVAPDGTGARAPVQVTGEDARRDLADPAWSPDGAQLAFSASLPEGMPELRTVPSVGGPATTVVRTVGGARQPTYQAVAPRDLSLTVSVGGLPGYVGGAGLPVTYTVRNLSPLPVTNAWVSLAVPASLLPVATLDPRCDAATAVCRLGDLSVGGQQAFTIVVAPRAGLVDKMAGRLTATSRTGKPITRFAEAPIQIRAPSVVVNPAIGPPGFVTVAQGAEFPPGTQVRLAWDFGITTTPDTVTVGPDGTFSTQMLVLRKDAIGPRTLRAELATGTAFGTVHTTRPFLVVQRPIGPPNFDHRR